jgi:hypothetical protein
VSYDYQRERTRLFADDGIAMLLKIWDSVRNHDVSSGACTIAAATRHVGGDSWLQLACLDYLVETGKIQYVCTRYQTQDWILRVIKREA